MNQCNENHQLNSEDCRRATCHSLLRPKRGRHSALLDRWILAFAQAQYCRVFCSSETIIHFTFCSPAARACSWGRYRSAVATDELYVSQSDFVSNASFCTACMCNTSWCEQGENDGVTVTL